MRPLVPAHALLQRRAGTGPRIAALTAGARADDEPAGATTIPDFVLDRLSDFSLLHSVPFQYLVPRASLLPAESIRVFTLDQAFIQALARGVLSVGEQSSADARLRLQADPGQHFSRLASVRARRRGLAARGGEDVPAPAAISGFLLRSALVTDYPALQVRAYGSNEPMAPALPLLRLDRLAPGILLALFAGPMAAVVLEEPHHGIRLGVDKNKLNGALVVQLRRADGVLTPDPGAPAEVAVPLRSGGASGVVDVAALAERIRQSGALGDPTNLEVTSSVLALQLLQAPVRQRFRRSTP